MNIEDSLRQARLDGADRLYGWPAEKQKPGPAFYALKAVDGEGRCHFYREMNEDSYYAAVKFWMASMPPQEAMFWRRDVA